MHPVFNLSQKNFGSFTQLLNVWSLLKYGHLVSKQNFPQQSHDTTPSGDAPRLGNTDKSLCLLFQSCREIHSSLVETWLSLSEKGSSVAKRTGFVPVAHKSRKRVCSSSGVGGRVLATLGSGFGSSHAEAG